MESLNVGILGGSFCCPNFGVGALTISQCNILNDIARKNNLIFYVICYESCIQNSYITKFSNLKIVLDTHTLNLFKMRKKLNRHDIIIDLYGGDSFSDIYSKKGFAIGCIQRIASIKKNKTYILGPQTIGPFDSILSRKLAYILMEKANKIFCRDKLSLKAIPASLRGKVSSVVDMAFRLPYENCIGENTDFLGINVSGLLWNSKLLGEKREDYKKTIYSILDYCRNNNLYIELVPHVNDIVDSTDGDYAISYKIVKEYNSEFIKLSPKFSNPIEAKNYINKFKLFIGSRMHATIASTSMGIPTLALAYSRKFSGLYQTIKYPYYVEKNSINEEYVLNKLKWMIDNYEKVKKDVDKSRGYALKIIKQYDEYLENIIGVLYENKY